jgi:hypothetical protein
VKLALGIVEQKHVTRTCCPQLLSVDILLIRVFPVGMMSRMSEFLDPSRLTTYPVRREYFSTSSKNLELKLIVSDQSV